MRKINKVSFSIGVFGLLISLSLTYFFWSHWEDIRETQMKYHSYTPNLIDSKGVSVALMTSFIFITVIAHSLTGKSINEILNLMGNTPNSKLATFILYATFFILVGLLVYLLLGGKVG